MLYVRFVVTVDFACVSTCMIACVRTRMRMRMGAPRARVARRPDMILHVSCITHAQNSKKMSAEPGRKAPYSIDLRHRMIWQKIGMGLTFRGVARNLNVAVGIRYCTQCTSSI